MLVAACGSPATETAEPAPAEQAESTSAATEDEGEQSGADAGSYEDVFAAVEGLEGEERAQALLEMAEGEGTEMLWYTAMRLDLAEQVAAAFGEEYGIDVEVYRADKDTVLRRVLEESSANYESSADVVEAPAVEMTRMSREGLFVPYESPVKEGLVPEAIYDDWTAERFNIFALAWNSDLVGGDEAPTAWQDLADDQYNGQLAVNRADADWYYALWHHWVEDEGMDPAEADQLFQDIAADSLVMQGHSERAALMAAGDFSLAAPLYTHVADAAINDGAPLSYEPYVGPVFLQPNGSALMETSDRPATAVLFLDWLLTDGQQYIADDGVTPALASLQEGIDAESVLIDVEGFVDEEEEWTTRWDELMRFGEVVQS